MKFTVNGYSQKKLIEMNLDLIDSLILRVLADMYSSNSNKIEYRIINDDKYMWSKYGYILEQIPIIGSERTLIRKIDSLIEKTILKKIVLTSKKGVKGKYLYIAFDKTYEELTEYQEPHDKMSIGTGNHMTNCQEPHDKMSSDHMTKCHIKDSSIIDSSIRDYKDDDTKLDKLNKIEDIPEKEKEVRPMVSSSIEFKDNLNKLKEIVIKATGLDKFRVENVILPSKYREIDMELLLKKISESKFLLGEDKKRKPTITNFSVKSMIDLILADAYKDKPEIKPVSSNAGCTIKRIPDETNAYIGEDDTGVIRWIFFDEKLGEGA